MKMKNGFPFLIGALLFTAWLNAQDVKPEPLPLYPNVEKAIELFLLEWTATGQRSLPSSGISIFKELRGPRYQLKLTRARTRSAEMPPRRRAGAYGFSFQSGGYGEMGIVFNPRTGSAEAGSETISGSRTVFRGGQGFGEEHSFSRSYERSYVRGNAEIAEDEKEPKEVGPLFSKVAAGQLFLFSEERAFVKYRNQVKKEKRLVTAGETAGQEDEPGYFYVVVTAETP